MKIYNEEKLKESIEYNCGRTYKQCTLSVMDTISDPNISFDENGICNYYHEYIEAEKKVIKDGEKAKLERTRLANQLKQSKNKEGYDCILGLSGGVDSTYLCLVAKELGLKPLLLHFDYGWNSEIAVQNIHNAVKATGFDLYTYVMDWPEFKNLQRSYFKASVLDLDVPADHMIFGALYKIAKEKGIKYVLSGNNVWTENTLPKTWNYNKFDLVNLRNIHKKFENTSLKKLPALGVWQFAYYQLYKKIERVNFLDIGFYNKAEVLKDIKEKLGWKEYGGKHHESVFTRFYQGYILPVKYGIDKRKAHLSNLIFSGQLTKEEALEELSQPIYSEDLIRQDFEFVAKKLGFTVSEFEKVVFQEPKSHESYGTDREERERYFRIMKRIKPITKRVKKVR